MTNSLIPALLLTLVSAGTPAQSDSTADRTQLVDYLIRSQQLLEDATNGLRDEQWHYRPAPGRWSVADCVEHLALAERTISGVGERARAAPPVPPADAATVRERDARLRRLATDRTEKFSAPEPLVPTGLAPRDALRLFHERRSATIAFTRMSQRDLRGHAADHPLFKNADGFQWLLLAAAHVERHVQQIREIKAASGFPR
jgi:hypothetical protein